MKSKQNKKLALNSRIQTYQILTNDNEICIPSLSSILLAVMTNEESMELFRILLAVRGKT